MPKRARSIISGLTIDELVEPGSVRLMGEALATIYAGLVARAK